MAGKPVVFHEDAAEDYEAAFEWYWERSSLAASKFSIEIIEAIEQIVKAPHTWPIYLYHTRRFPLHRFPYKVIYRELPSSIQILAVAHVRRRPGYWKDRLRSPV
jgi:plasmid stabilization system protein ParE